jgi:DNA-binding MarR family transcriptional regulator
VQTAQRAARRFRDVFGAHGLTAHQFGVLVQLSIQPGVSQAALARHILITPQSMGEVLQQMESAGLITRVPPPRRGTAIDVRLTEEGQQALAATYPDVAAINTPAALGLDDADAATLNALLHRVLTHFEGAGVEPSGHPL